MTTYLDLARRDYISAKVLVEGNLYNNASLTVHACCEKMIKNYLKEDNRLSKMLGMTLNLKLLYEETRLQDEGLKQDMEKLNKYRHDTTYPGPNFINVTRKEIEHALEVCSKLAGGLGYNLG